MAENKNRNIFEALVNLNENKVISLVTQSVRENKSFDEIMSQLQDALTEIGNRYEKEEYYVPDLIYSGAIMKKAVELLSPLKKDEDKGNKGKVIMGTVYGDVHDIGKDLVVMLLSNAGFEVVDLGTSVEPKKFVEAINENNAKVIGMSCLLTISFGAIANTVKAIEEGGIRNNVSIMVGGAPVSTLVAEKTGCDFYGKDAFAAVKFATDVYAK